MSDLLAYQIARDHVVNFGKTEALMKQHHDAMDCYNCEAFLQSGVDAFQWIQRADETIRKALYTGVLQPDSELEDVDRAMESLLRLWLEPCDFAEAWIGTNLQRGWKIDNLDEFRRCETEVRAIVRSSADTELPEAIRAMRDKAIEDHRNGKTTEFI